MVTFLKTKQTAGGLYVEGFCEDGDTIPVVGICNGSKMESIDEDGAITEYRYVASQGAWLEVGGEVDEDEEGDGA